MKASLFLVIGLALMLGMMLERPVVASTGFPAVVDAPGIQSIHHLKRSSKEGGEPSAAVRDPFFLPTPPSAALDQPALLATPVSASTAPAFPAFQILGKQEDDDGWAVFISAPEQPGQLWVVREGETFNDNFQVSKLNPPQLTIKSTRNRQSRTFDIGKNDE